MFGVRLTADACAVHEILGVLREDEISAEDAAVVIGAVNQSAG
jgi:hypothetical protein